MKVRQKIAKIIALVLALTITLQSTAFDVLAASETSASQDTVTAAQATGEENDLQAAAEGQKVWHIGATTDDYGNQDFGAASGKAFFALSDTQAIAKEDFEVSFRADGEKNRMAFVNKYVSDTEWSYIGYNPTNWYLQWAGTGAGNNWADISKDTVPLPNANDMMTIRGTWTEKAGEGDAETAVLKLTFVNETTGTTKEYTVASTEMNGMYGKTGKVGFRAGFFNGQATDYYVDGVSIGGTAWNGELVSYETQKAGAVLESMDELPEITDPAPDPDPDPTPEPGDLPDGPTGPTTGDGQMWYKVTGGAGNGGGHAYGNAAASAPVVVVDRTRTMPKDGAVSLKFKPQGGSPNFGIFYTYKDDNNWLYVGYDNSSNWYYQYKFNGQESYPKLTGLPAPAQGKSQDISISLSRETLAVTVDGVTVRAANQTLLEMAEAINGAGRFGVKTNGNNNPVSFTEFKLGNTDCMADSWTFLVNRTGQLFEREYTPVRRVGGQVLDDKTSAPLTGATVRIGAKRTITDASGNFTFEGILQDITPYDISVSMQGYLPYSQELVVDGDKTSLSFRLTSQNDIDLTDYYGLTSGAMTAYVAKDFPRVLKYDINGKTAFMGQVQEITQLKINNTAVTPTVTVKEKNNNSIIYTLAIAQEALNLEMDVKVSVESTNLTWEVTRIAKAEGCAMIGTIEVPGLNLVTIDAYPAQAPAGMTWDNAFMGAKTSSVTTESGDERITFEDGFVPMNKDGYLYGFLSGNGYSAGLFSNSEAEDDKRVLRVNGADTISMTSSPWYYELGDKGGQGYKNAQAGYRKSELPVAKVCIADDKNDDKIVNWQDGAIAYRSIMHNPKGWEAMKDNVGFRIVMNFSSSAPNPFLETADNIKKVYLATDGLPQAVVLKGYGNEGHDSANSEYADIAEREGGVKDFQSLIKIAHQYRAQVGIHVNAQEAYPEAASFNNAMVGAGANGSGAGNGWGWLDQSHTIDKLWDLQTEARYKRLIQLYDRINGTSFYSIPWDIANKVNGAVGESRGEITAAMDAIRADAAKRPDNMDFIYLDVWYQNAWETRRVAEEFNSLGWNFSTEFATQGEYDSIWQHWATDATYGGAKMKGFNSSVIRFIRNHQRDSQVLNYPEFSGTADNPLLGGFRLRGFEGWGGDNNYDSFIYNTFKDNVPTRFLQHYEVTKWVTDENVPTANKEKEITLKNSKNDTVVVTRVNAQRTDDEIEREITLNGNNVLSCTPDHFYYLLPWTDEDGSEKLYHWNMDGGDSSWKLPASWNGNVYLYQLTDQGRTQEQELTVTNGTLNLTGIEAGKPYVVVKKAGYKELKADYGENDYVVDPGFNGYEEGDALSADEWTGDLDSFVVSRGDRGDQFVQVTDADKTVAASTTISGLTAGKDYVAEIYVDNRSDAKAYLEITNGAEVLSNYTERSIAKNYIQCDEQHTRDGAKAPSYMQHIQIAFRAAGATAVFTLKREAGDGVTMWDDIRIVEKKLDNYQADGSFRQDFESVVQGIYPFVVGPAQGVTDTRTHLSELHEPYTQKGWNGRVIDDVITNTDGPNGENTSNWSLKNHCNATGILYQTIPQNFRFEKGHVYNVEFDYQTGSSNAYSIVIGNEGSYEAVETFAATTNGTEHCSFTVTGGANGQTWIGLHSNGNVAAGAMGQLDFILDNLVITENTEEVQISTDTTSGRDYMLVGEKLQLTATNSEGGTWSSDNTNAVTVNAATGLATAVGAGEATITFTKGSKTVTVTLTVKASILLDAQPEAAYANTEETTGEDAPAANTVDGDSGSFWHSAYNPSKFTVSDSNPAIITVDLGEEKELAGFYFLQRKAGENGLVGQYKWAVGSEFDQASNTITGATLSSVVTVSELKAGTTDEGVNGARESVMFDTPTRARYIQIQITKSKNAFAALAEIGALLNQMPATAASIDKTTDTVMDGETTQLTVTATAGEYFISPKWESSDRSVAAVDKNGLVTGRKPGTATITFTAGNDISLSCAVTVTANPDKPSDVKVTAITLSKTAAALKLGEAVTLKATVTPDNAADKALSWTTSNKAVATVNRYGGITAKGIGTATIRATAKDGSGKYAECAVTVTANVADVKVTSVTMNKASSTLLIGGTETLTATVAPANATNKALEWKSANPAVATVSGGKVTAVAAGTAVITASAADGSGKFAACTITVTAPVKVAGISLNTTAKTMKKGEKLTLTATITPADAADKTVTWKSSNNKVAMVTGGKVVAMGGGTAIITATAKDGGKTATCKITVPYTIKYMLNKGKNNKSNPATYTANKVTLKAPARKDYAFKGWYADKKLKKKVTSVSGKDMTVYAKWAKVTKKATVIQSAKNSKKGQIALKLKKVAGAQYEITYSTDKKMKKAVQKTASKKPAAVIKKGLKKGKTYYVRVRTFKKDSAGMNVYSKYTKIKKVKVTK